MNTTSLKSFNYLEDGRIIFSMLESIKTTKILDPGLYSLYKTQSFSNSEIILAKETIKELHELLPFHFLHKTDNIFNAFFNKNILKQVNKLNYNHKTGILLYGKQGTSKSSILKHYYNRAIEEYNALVFYFSSLYCVEELWTFISDIRKIQDNPIIIFLDEFDEVFKDKKEEFFKTIMDGHLSINNCMFLATTNYIDVIPKAIKERPSRIKYLIEVEGIQEKPIIFHYLKQSFKTLNIEITNQQLSDLTDKSVGKTIDELKEIVLDKLMNIEKEEKQTKRIGFNI